MQGESKDGSSADPKLPMTILPNINFKKKVVDSSLLIAKKSFDPQLAADLSEHKIHFRCPSFTSAKDQNIGFQGNIYSPKNENFNRNIDISKC